MPADPLNGLHPALAGAVRTDLAADVIVATRESLNERRREAVAQIDTAGVSINDAEAAGVPVRIYRGGPAQDAPAVIYCHAGAFVLGNLDTDHRQCVELARRGRCTVVSVDYRLAPEHPFPAALDDALSVLRWVVDSAVELGIDTTRLAVVGSSAGAALAAGLAQQATDGTAPRVVLQLLHQPVLDDRGTPSKTEFGDSVGFDGVAAELMWRYYLGGTAPSVRAAPAGGSR